MADIPSSAPIIAPGIGGKRAFVWNPALIVGLSMFGVVVLVAILAPIFMTESATKLAGSPNLSSVPGHFLGTDVLGRDMLARTLVATRVTVIMAAAATLLAAVAGIGFGIAVWLAPPRLRELGLRLIEFAVSYPTLLVAIIVAAILGKGVGTAVIAIAVANTAGFARLTANLAAGIAAQDYVSTARLMGVPGHKLATRHVLPNMAEPMLIITAQAFGGALVEISGLSFVGLGAQSPSFDYGTILSDGLTKIGTNPILVVGPAAALIFVSVAALFVGDGLAAAANPRSNGTRARLKRSAAKVDAVVTDTSDALLVVDGLTVRQSATNRTLVNNISFTVNRGEVLGIVGESGSGKSLTASVIGQLLSEGLDATAQRVTVGDTDLLVPVSPRELVSRIGLIYQDPGTSLNPALTLGSQLSDVLTTRLGKSRRAARETLLSAFRSVLLSDPEGRLKQHPHALSGGMKQRAMIASAMSTGPDLLIADEPTTALDVTVQREVLGIIKKMNREQGTAVLFISHDLAV
ncbi:MAG: putative oligopeptide transport system (integral rane and ATP-binding protein), partial [Glaciihabitans sp.]|nr:putative oligopeptide transport system (integral rane and ATP-binding protein) [Glaciihabitans sp.]